MGRPERAKSGHSAPFFFKFSQNFLILAYLADWPWWMTGLQSGLCISLKVVSDPPPQRWASKKLGWLIVYYLGGFMMWLSPGPSPPVKRPAGEAYNFAPINTPYTGWHATESLIDWLQGHDGQASSEPCHGLGATEIRLDCLQPPGFGTPTVLRQEAARSWGGGAPPTEVFPRC